MNKSSYIYFIVAIVLSILSCHISASDEPRVSGDTKQIIWRHDVKWLHEQFKNISPSTPTKRYIEPFISIKPNWTLEKIISTVGFPDYETGSGISIFVYEQSDDSKIWIGFANIDGNPIYVTHIKSNNDNVQLLSN
mgnify:CR=1 FL=1